MLIDEMINMFWIRSLDIAYRFAESLMNYRPFDHFVSRLKGVSSAAESFHLPRYPLDGYDYNIQILPIKE